MTVTAYPCPCCGYRTFGAPPPDTYIVCPVCFWEDLPSAQLWPEIYCAALRRAQRSFLTTGACQPQYIEAVRPPNADESRPAGWLTLDAQIERLDQQIRIAFAEVTRGDGITLHEADALDIYASDEELVAARQLDTERHWYDVPDAVIERMGIAFSFLDDAGFHYYLPAYLSWSLRHYDSSDSISADRVLYALALQPWKYSQQENEAQNRKRFRRLTSTQAQVVCRVLRFFVAYCYPCVDVKLAQKALDQYWEQFCSASG